MSLNVVILAAGKGTRMSSHMPKVLHQIAGKSMLEHVIHTAQSLKPSNINVVIGYGKEQVLNQLAHHTDINWVEQTEQLGTGHALKMALPHIPPYGRTLVLYGDVPLIDTDTLVELLDTAGDQVALLTDILDNPAGYGRIIRQKDGKVESIIEEKDARIEQKAIREVNTGIFVFPNRCLANWLDELNAENTQGEYYLTDVIALAVRDGIDVHPVTVHAFYLAAGVNNKIQLAELERIYQREQSLNLLKKGVTLRDPSRVDIRGSLKVGQDVIIDINCLFEGENELADNVQIGANCVIKNAKIGAGSVIQPFSHLEDCEIGAQAQIGPFARLRPQAILADEVHIGNFVEVKNTTIGKGSKANHLSYLGDATIGSQTNIGAGSITCNYDGVNKHHTTIGNEVRIGSDTMLVAPVHIGDRATIGAGSVITKDCAPDKLTIARAQQTVIDDWQRPEKAPVQVETKPTNTTTPTNHKTSNTKKRGKRS